MSIRSIAISVTVTGFLLNGCMVVSEAMVIEQVSADKKCPANEISVKDRERVDGRCNFEVDACGKTYIYQTAPVIFEKGSEPDTLKK